MGEVIQMPDQTGSIKITTGGPGLTVEVTTVRVAVSRSTALYLMRMLFGNVHLSQGLKEITFELHPDPPPPPPNPPQPLRAIQGGNQPRWLSRIRRLFVILDSDG